MRESRANARAAAVPCANSRAMLVREKAVELFAAQGFGQVSMRDLASHSGIQVGSIYHHFESKESLLFEIGETLYETLWLNAQTQLRRQRKVDEMLLALLRAHISLYRDKALYFHVTEHDARHLGAQHGLLLDQLRARYEHCFIQLLSPSAPCIAALAVAVHSMVSILNTLPALLDTSSLSAALLDDLILTSAQSPIRWALKRMVSV